MVTDYLIEKLEQQKLLNIFTDLQNITDPETISEYVNSRKKVDRTAIIANPLLTIKQFEKLSKDRVLQVRQALVFNPNLPSNIARVLLKEEPLLFNDILQYGSETNDDVVIEYIELKKKNTELDVIGFFNKLCLRKNSISKKLHEKIFEVVPFNKLQWGNYIDRTDIPKDLKKEAIKKNLEEESSTYGSTLNRILSKMSSDELKEYLEISNKEELMDAIVALGDDELVYYVVTKHPSTNFIKSFNSPNHDSIHKLSQKTKETVIKLYLDYYKSDESYTFPYMLFQAKLKVSTPLLEELFFFIVREQSTTLVNYEGKRSLLNIVTMDNFNNKWIDELTDDEIYGSTRRKVVINYLLRCETLTEEQINRLMNLYNDEFGAFDSDPYIALASRKTPMSDDMQEEQRAKEGKKTFYKTIVGGKKLDEELKKILSLDSDADKKDSLELISQNIKLTERNIEDIFSEVKNNSSLVDTPIISNLIQRDVSKILFKRMIDFTENLQFGISQLFVSQYLLGYFLESGKQPDNLYQSFDKEKKLIIQNKLIEMKKYPFQLHNLLFGLLNEITFEKWMDKFEFDKPYGKKLLLHIIEVAENESRLESLFKRIMTLEPLQPFDKDIKVLDAMFKLTNDVKYISKEMKDVFLF